MYAESEIKFYKELKKCEKRMTSEHKERFNDLLEIAHKFNIR